MRVNRTPRKLRAGPVTLDVRAGGISLYPDRLSGLLAATLFVLAGSSECLLAGVVGTGGWGAIGAL